MAGKHLPSKIYQDTINAYIPDAVKYANETCLRICYRKDVSDWNSKFHSRMRESTQHLRRMSSG